MKTNLATHPARLAILGLLDQSKALLAAVDDSGYSHPEAMAMNASLGGHMRHVLEHIEPILSCPASGVLDYDARPRDQRLESSRSIALSRVEACAEALRSMPDAWEADALRIRNRISEGEDGVVVAASSRLRELIYAVAHTVHHFALIRVMCNLRGILLPTGFGYAPSTLHHLQSTGEK